MAPSTPDSQNFNSLMAKFHKISRHERLERVQAIAGLSDEDVARLAGEIPVPIEIAENLVENVIGYFPIPFGVATYFNIDGRNLLIPMAVEETSIIAAASATAKWVTTTGEIKTWAQGRLIIGQIQLPHCQEIAKTIEVLDQNRLELIDHCNSFLPGLAA